MKKFLKLATLLVAIVMIFGLQSCTSMKKMDNSQLGGYWVLKTLNGEDSKSLFKGPIPTMEFNFADSMVSGSAGCNRYFSKFELTDGNEFTASHPGSTMMACAFENAEDKFLQTVSIAKLVMSIDNGLLTFSHDKRIVMQFEKGEKEAVGGKGLLAVTNESISGTWTLRSVAGQEVSKLFSNTMPTLTMTSEGQASGNAGCNNYRSKYELKGNTISFGPLMSTKMACPQLEGETVFSKLLETPMEVVLSAKDRMVLSKAGVTVMEFTKASDAE